MLKHAGRALAAFTLLYVSFVAAGGVMAGVGSKPPRGAQVDIGEGRTLRLVCEGEARADRPTVWLEAGAFGFAADWGATQDALAAAGWRACAYDRAGMGYSPPGPAPRDGLAIVTDFEKLVAASGEKGPFILVGHSMAGLRLREYAGRNPSQVAGLVLVDAATPEAAQLPLAKRFLSSFVFASRAAALGASAGLYKPLVYTPLGDKIGLPPDAKAEKRWGFASGRHNRTSAAEVELWAEASAQAGAEPPFAPEWPVAVVTAGARVGDRVQWKDMQAAPAQASQHGYVDHVAGASHTRLLGGEFADHIVRAVAFVAAERGKPAAALVDVTAP